MLTVGIGFRQQVLIQHHFLCVWVKMLSSDCGFQASFVSEHCSNTGPFTVSVSACGLSENRNQSNWNCGTCFGAGGRNSALTWVSSVGCLITAVAEMFKAVKSVFAASHEVDLIISVSMKDDCCDAALRCWVCTVTPLMTVMLKGLHPTQRFLVNVFSSKDHTSGHS